MMRFVNAYGMALVVAGAVLSACSDSSDSFTGTVTDTGNTLAQVREVSGAVALSDGKFAVGATVRMASVVEDGDSMQAPQYIETVTDSKGKFAFDSALADTFQLAVIDTVRKEISYLPKTTAGAEKLEKISLEKAAVFSGVLYNDKDNEPAVSVGSHFKVAVPGTPFFQSVFDADSFFMLIPAGKWDFAFCPGDPQIISKLEESGVEDSLIYRSWSMTDSVKAGDTLFAGPFIWSPNVKADSLIKEEEKVLENTSRISGRVYCKSGKECAGVEVQMITDIFGFDFVEGDETGFVAQTVTDSLGYWYLPVPAEVPFDSFRVEFRRLNKDSTVSESGLSRYVKASEVMNIKDTLSIGKTTLSRPSALLSGVTLVIDKRDTSQSNNCMAYSVVVGIKGTSHFIRGVTCNMFRIDELPAGTNDIVLYPGDTRVISALQEREAPLKDYVTVTHVELPEDESLDQQWMTYTPPSVANSAK